MMASFSERSAGIMAGGNEIQFTRPGFKWNHNACLAIIGQKNVVMHVSLNLDRPKCCLEQRRNLFREVGWESEVGFCMLLFVRIIMLSNERYKLHQSVTNVIR